MREGGRVVIDTAQRSPLAGERFVLWYGNLLFCTVTGMISGTGRQRAAALVGSVLRASTRFSAQIARQEYPKAVASGDRTLLLNPQPE